MTSSVDTEGPDRESTRRPPHLFRLVLVYGPEPTSVGQVQLLDQLPLVIGRKVEHGNALVLHDPKASRSHACIEASELGIRIRDLASKNGVAVNGQLTESAELVDGDVIRIGSHLFVLQALDEETRAALMGGGRLSLTELTGQSPRLLAVLRKIEQFAPADHPVLILGETGVGKELVARALHRVSGRKGAMVPVNCGALPANLIESELFGHDAGAFTGALQERSGLFDEADGGTIFLDEIGDMPMPLQVSLLRVLATGEVRRVGSRRFHSVDARVIAATHVDIEAGAARGAFRGDLYGRLRAAVIEVPPLRKRKEDILELARRFLMSSPGHGSRADSRARARLEFSPDVAEVLLTHDWPFNVRELEQVMATMASSASSDSRLECRHLPASLRSRSDLIRARAPEQDDTGELATAPALDRDVGVLGVARRLKPSAEQLRSVLRHYKGNVAQVAIYFFKDRRQIYRWCEQLQVDPLEMREKG
ncbi:MAG: sigma 54-interacting transcriptional regulator [Myxococcales bacterium]